MEAKGIMNFHPLSYNEIQTDTLLRTLYEYRGKSHAAVIADFEKAVADYTGARFVVAVNSGTSAIHLALCALGVASGDVVIAPTFTYVATINPILYVGATPFFIDCEAATWNMDPDLLEIGIKENLKIGRKVGAIIVVHTYGMPCQWEKIKGLADQYSIPVIEDAAESLGSTYAGKMTGTLGNVGVYSFNNNKLFTTFGGGALVTDNENLVKTTRRLAAQARENEKFYLHKEVGFNYQMSVLNAAYGVATIAETDQYVSSRRNLFDHYQKTLIDVEFQVESTNSKSNRWLSAFVFTKPSRNQLVYKDLMGAGWESRFLWNPMHRQPAFTQCEGILNGTADFLFSKGLCLPSNNAIQTADLLTVCNKIYLST